MFSHKKDIFFKDLNISQDIITRSLRESVIFSDENTIILQSLFWNLLYEVIIFFTLAVFLFFYFSSTSQEEIQEEYKEITQDPSNIFDKEKLSFFAKKFSYYIGFILFYISFYLISLGVDFLNFSFVILLLHIIIFIYYFISKQNKISRNFLKINSIVFSFFYLINYFFIIFSWENYFWSIDFFNGFLILGIFPTLLYFDTKDLKQKKFDESLLIHASIYLFGFALFYVYFYIFKENLFFWFSVLSTLFGIFWFELFPKIKIFHYNEIILKYIGIIFSYMGVIFGMLYLWFQFSYIIFWVLLLQTGYHFFIHRKYINYISYILGIFLVIFLIFYSIFHFSLLDYRHMSFMIFTFILSFGIILATYKIPFSFEIDIQILHIFAHIINVFGVGMFFVFNHFEILYIWVLLLIESLYFFASYNKLHPN